MMIPFDHFKSFAENAVDRYTAEELYKDVNNLMDNAMQALERRQKVLIPRDQYDRIDMDIIRWYENEYGCELVPIDRILCKQKDIEATNRVMNLHELQTKMPISEMLDIPLECRVEPLEKKKRHKTPKMKPNGYKKKLTYSHP